MSGKVHFLSSEEPIKGWESFRETKALCHVLVKEPRPVFTVNLAEGEIQSASTIQFCRVCLLLALQPVYAPVKGMNWIYGVLSAEQARHVNSDGTGFYE